MIKRRLTLALDRCGPCKAIEPVVHKLATEYTGRVQVRRLPLPHPLLS